jgi:hypothetical protein
LLLHASHAALPILNSSKLPPVVDAADLFFLIIDKTIRNSKFRSLTEATPYHHNLFTFTLFLPEGRAGVAWEPSNKIMLYLSLSLLSASNCTLFFTFHIYLPHFRTYYLLSNLFLSEGQVDTAWGLS